MRRGYSRRDYLDRIHRLKTRRPEVALSTDIIVGFPGETEEEFDQTLEILWQVEYDEIFSFMYSPRPQTVSAKLFDDDIPDAVKKDRLMRVQSLQQVVSLRKNRERIGSVEEILVEGPSKLKNGQIMGRTRANRIVNFKGPATLTGTLVPVRITGATATSLRGEIFAELHLSDFKSEGEMA
jgi:tRNA-2-methylthio-N6-dimethylallyladenosine synthase